MAIQASDIESALLERLEANEVVRSNLINIEESRGYFRGVREMAEGHGTLLNSILWGILFFHWRYLPQARHRYAIMLIESSQGLHRCGSAFEVYIVSPQFDGKRLLERHKLVNAALAEEMKSIHALTIKRVWTPQQKLDNPGS